MKKLSYLIVLALILGLVLTGCLLTNVGQVPVTEQSGITYLTKNGLLTGLVGLWSFEEGKDPAIAYDSSGNGNNGTVSGAEWFPGKFGDALKFDGVDDYVEVDYSTSMGVYDSYTFEAWIYLESLGTSDLWVYRGFFRRGTLGVLASEIEIYTQPYVPSYNGKLTVVHNRGGVFCYRYFTPFPLDQWVYLAVIWDGTTSKAYYNGIEQSSTGLVIVDSAVSDKPSFIGVGYYTAYMKGLIDEVRIWNTVLAPGTIADHAEGIYGFNGLLAPYAPPDQKAFKLGSTIPLKWQYTDSSGEVFDSIDANPEVKCQFAGGGNGDGDLISPEDPGSSGLRYNSDTKTWQFNWQTKGLITGIGEYNIWIASKLTGQVNGPFLIELR